MQVTLVVPRGSTVLLKGIDEMITTETDRESEQVERQAEMQTLRK